MNLNQHRQDRAARMVTRAVHRFQAHGALFVREDGETLPVQLYRGRPSWTDSTAVGIAARALYNWTCSKQTLAEIRRFAGGDGFFGGCSIRYSGDLYQIDKLVPYVETGLGDGYTIQTVKVGPDETGGTSAGCCRVCLDADG